MFWVLRSIVLLLKQKTSERSWEVKEMTLSCLGLLIHPRETELKSWNKGEEDTVLFLCKGVTFKFHVKCYIDALVIILRIWKNSKYMGVSKHRGFYPPKWMVKIMENPMNKWIIWGYHYFWKHPYSEVGSGTLRMAVVCYFALAFFWTPDPFNYIVPYHWRNFITPLMMYCEKIFSKNWSKKWSNQSLAVGNLERFPT